MDGTSAQPGPAIDWVRIRAGVDEAKAAGGSPSEILRRYGALAFGVATGSVEARRKLVAGQLPLTTWPAQRVLVAAVNAETGERRAFDRESGIDLIDAVIATTAAFGAPLLPFDGHHYIDGGYYSSDNADLAIGYERVLILALRSPPQAMRLIPIEAGVDALRISGSRVEVIHPDEETIAAMVAAGGQMNPASGRPAAIAGRLHGQRVASALASFWR